MPAKASAAPSICNAFRLFCRGNSASPQTRRASRHASVGYHFRRGQSKGNEILTTFYFTARTAREQRGQSLASSPGDKLGRSGVARQRIEHSVDHAALFG